MESTASNNSIKNHLVRNSKRFAVSAIGLGSIKSECDNWRMGYEISLVVMIACICGATIGLRYESAGAYIATIIFTAINFLFSLAGIILVHYNTECIHASYPYICCALLLWCWTAYDMFQFMCGGNKKE
jgi:hypothetical protein